MKFKHFVIFFGRPFKSLQSDLFEEKQRIFKL